MKSIKFKTIKNTKVEINLVPNKEYKVKDMKKLIDDQYGWDQNKIKIYSDKNDLNSLLNDEESLTQYIKQNNKNDLYYYLKNYKYIPIYIDEEKKNNDNNSDFDYDKFVSSESSSNSLMNMSNPKIQSVKSSVDLNKNNNKTPSSENSKINSENLMNNKRKNMEFKNNNNNDFIGSDKKNNNSTKNLNSHVQSQTNNVKTEQKNQTNIGKNDKNEKNSNNNNKENNFNKSKNETKTNNIPNTKPKKYPSADIYTEEENEKIQNLIDFTGCTRDKGIKALKQTYWNLEEAGNIVFDL